MFNCGFGEHAESGGDPDLDTWKPALSQLVREADTPVIVTSYNLTEAEKDLKLISEANAGKLKVEVGAQENPFRGHRPFRDFEFCQNRDVFFHNQYYSVVKRLEKEEKEEAP